MDSQRRNFIRLTAAGLIHIAARPFEATAGSHTDANLLIRQAAERGHTDLGWLDSYHTFSFGPFAASYQRRPDYTGPRIPHAPTSKHGDSFLRAERSTPTP